MVNFNIGETVICLIEIRDADRDYKSPSIPVRITITDKFRAVKVNDVAMTNDATGKYHYDCQTAGYIDGKYEIKYTAIDGTRIIIEKDEFTLKK